MYIVSTGMVCPVGHNAAAACAGMRSGVDGFADLPFDDSNGQPVVGAKITDLDTDRVQRLAEMLKIAILDCIGDEPEIPTANVPLLIGFEDSERPTYDGRLPSTVLEIVLDELPFEFDSASSQVICKGNTAGFEGLRLARDLASDAKVAGCLICGVDSSIDAVTIGWLEQHWRLKREDYSNGVIPGEAASAVLVQAFAPMATTRVRLAGLGFGYEKATVLSEEPLLGLGLADAAQTALAEAGLKMNEITFRLSDVTGESYGFKEQALVMSRVMREGREELPIWHCAEFIGDVGAASSVCQLVLAHDAFLKDYAPGKYAMCFASAVFGHRAVAVLCRETDDEA